MKRLCPNFDKGSSSIELEWFQKINPVNFAVRRFVEIESYHSQMSSFQNLLKTTLATSYRWK